MSYRITLDVWISEDCTWPSVAVQTQLDWPDYTDRAVPSTLLETRIAEPVLTEVRQFAEMLQRGEQPSSAKRAA